MRTMMMLVVGVVVVLACAALGSEKIQGNGVQSSETRHITELSEVQVGGGIEVVIKAGPPGVVVETDQNLLSVVKTEVRGNTLHIGTPDVTARPTRGIRVLVTLGMVSALDVRGGSDVTLLAPSDAALSLEVSGGSKVRAPKISTAKLQLKASGGPDISLAGNAPETNVQTSGGVQLHSAQLKSKSMALDASGGCVLDVAASDTVTGHISGGVDVTVHGEPKMAVTHTGGAAVHVKSDIRPMAN